MSYLSIMCLKSAKQQTEESRCASTCLPVTSVYRKPVYDGNGTHFKSLV